MTTTRQRQDKMNYESKLNVQPKDPSSRHFYISMAKSTLRMIGCVLGVLLQSVSVLAFMFLAAEILGIAEEL